MKKTTYLIVAVVEEDDFPIRYEPTVIDADGEELTSSSRVPTNMLPPAYQALSAWLGGGR